MRKNKSLIRFTLFFALSFLSIYLIKTASAQTNPNQIIDRQTDDAIGVRVVPNYNHFSIYRWYESQGFKGSPQALTVDGYEALRDGRTVYVNAANVDISSKTIYTNIYLISYNQDPNVKTVDILGQIVSHWKFNDNLPKEESTCSIAAVKCEKDSECPSTQSCSTITGACALKEVKNCVVDSDCPANFFCDSLKAKVVRDSKRIGKLEEMREALAKYRTVNGTYPLLSAGTYLPGKTTSLWPSWNEVLMPALAIKQGMTDPINRLGLCPDFDSKTCWDKDNKKFVYEAASASLQLPKDSYALVYGTNDAGSEYNLCAVLESRDSFNSNLGYHFSPNDPNSSECVTATGILASGNVSNTAPKIIEMQLKGWTGREYNGFVKAMDAEKDPLTWTMEPVTTNWPNWLGAPPIIKGTSDANQKKIFADKAGDAGTYAIKLTVADNKGLSTSTTTNIEIIPASSFAQADNYVYNLDPIYPFSYTLYVAGSTGKPSYSVSGGPDILRMPNIIKTETADGVNRLKVTYSGVISTSTKFLEDASTTYSLVVDGKAANNFSINIKVDKPLMDFNCSTQSRTGASYNCLLGSTKQGNHTLTYSSLNTLPVGLAVVADIEHPENIYLTGTTTVAKVNQEIKIKAVNEYGTENTKSFVLNVNTYCGDGLKQAPNTEGKGGVFNNGFEACDGTADVATSAADSSKIKQYACNTTSASEPTPYPIPNNSYCIFKSPLAGGGYCGDTYCQVGLEKDCTLDCCKSDCDPTYSGGFPTLVDGKDVTANCNSGLTCDPGYQCTSSGACEKMCWQITETKATSVTIKEGDAFKAGAYSVWPSSLKNYNFSSTQINNKFIGGAKECSQNNSTGATSPSPLADCSVVRLDNPICASTWASDFTPNISQCPTGFRGDFKAIASTIGGDNCRQCDDVICTQCDWIAWGTIKVCSPIISPWRARKQWTCSGVSAAAVNRCYLDSCTSSNNKAGKISSDGTCVETPTTPPADGATCYSSWSNDCPAGQICEGAYGHCGSRQNDNIGGTGAQCAQFDEYYCPGSPVSGGCDWVVDETGVCVSNTNNNPPYVPPTGTATSCYPGSYFNVISNACFSCPIGFSCADGKEAVVCQVGTYTDTTGNISCKPCDAGYYCLGMSSKTGCFAGTYRDTAGASNSGNCPKCPIGTYTNTIGNTQCITCPAGSYNLTTGNTSCTQCEAGYYCTGGSNKTACPAGTYRNQLSGTSSSSCTACSAGTYSAYSASTSCTSCQAGTYNTQARSTDCDTCEANYICAGGYYHSTCSSLTGGLRPYSSGGSYSSTQCSKNQPLLQ